MMFKNAIVYLVDPAYRIDPALLRRQSARQCGATELRTDGFCAPCDHAEGLVHVVAGHQLICLQTEEKLLPSAVIAEAVKEAVETVEESQGHRVGRKQMKEIKERVTLDLLPQAFTTKKRTFALIVGEYFIIDTSSAAKADVVLTALRKALEMPLAQLRPVLSPASAMNNWLLSGECPSGFTVDRDCELRDSTEEKATVRYVHHDLEGDEIRAHIAAGKSATRLGITWSNRVSFVLTDQFQIKRLAFMDFLKEEAEQEAETMAELFDADIAIMAGELSRMIADLTTELGGIIRPKPDLIDGEATP
jgi:recombination associated protein RdgC